MLHSLRFQILFLAGATLAWATAAGAAPTNVIVMIGDGMGPQQEQAARYYSGAPLAWDSATYSGQMTTDMLPSGTPPSTITDSAASATAMATGNKVTEFVISQDPGGAAYPSSLEHHKGNGKSTGLVSTAFIEDATPAAFGAHAPNRFFYIDIAADYLNDSRPNVLMGGTFPGLGIDPTNAAAAGYSVVTDRAQMNALDITLPTHVSGQFAPTSLAYEFDYAQGSNNFYDTQPFLSEMTQFSLDFLEQDPDGFFLMVEQEKIDESGHGISSDPDKLERNIFATLEFSKSVQVVLDWIAARPDPSDTLLIVTADHETGGLQLTADNGVGNVPTHTWEGENHTGIPVNVYAWGPNGQLVSGTIDNTDIYGITILPEPGVAMLGALALLALARRVR